MRGWWIAILLVVGAFSTSVPTATASHGRGFDVTCPAPPAGYDGWDASAQATWKHDHCGEKIEIRVRIPVDGLETLVFDGDTVSLISHAAPMHAAGEAGKIVFTKGNCRSGDCSPLGWIPMHPATCPYPCESFKFNLAPNYGRLFEGGSVTWNREEGPGHVKVDAPPRGVAKVTVDDNAVAGIHTYQILLTILQPSLAESNPGNCPPPPSGQRNWTHEERDAWAKKHCAPPGCPMPPPEWSAWNQSQRDVWTKDHCTPHCPPPPPESRNWTDEARRDWFAANCKPPPNCHPAPREAWNWTHEQREKWAADHCAPPGCPPPPDTWRTMSPSEREAWMKNHCAAPPDPCPKRPPDFDRWTEEQKKQWYGANCRPQDPCPPPPPDFDKWRAEEQDAWKRTHCYGGEATCPPFPDGYFTWSKEAQEQWKREKCAPPESACPPPPSEFHTWSEDQKKRWYESNCRAEHYSTKDHPGCTARPPDESASWGPEAWRRWAVANCALPECATPHAFWTAVADNWQVAWGAFCKDLCPEPTKPPPSGADRSTWAPCARAASDSGAAGNSTGGGSGGAKNNSDGKIVVPGFEVAVSLLAVLALAGLRRR